MIPHSQPTGMQGFVFNTRRAMFADVKTREALNHAFDFEWSNKQFAFGSYIRTDSYFENSELAATGVPSGRELEILESFRGKIPDSVFTTPFTNPKTSGSGQDMRAHLSKAKQMLAEAGWKPGKDGVLERGGQKFEFEFLMSSEMFERWVAPLSANLKKLGITVTMRTVDTAQYQNRIDNFDFDMTVGNFGQSLSPGNEQYDFWGSAKADVNGSRNIIGIKDPVVDALIQQIITAPDREELIHRTRALDRVLLAGHYLIPNWHIGAHRIAYWDKFGKPAISPKYGMGVPDTWWFDTARAAKVADKIKPADKKAE
jgi:microcin C transport system substrate-binding protein